MNKSSFLKVLLLVYVTNRKAMVIKYLVTSDVATFVLKTWPCGIKGLGIAFLLVAVVVFCNVLPRQKWRGRQRI